MVSIRSALSHTYNAGVFLVMLSVYIAVLAVLTGVATLRRGFARLHTSPTHVDPVTTPER